MAFGPIMQISVGDLQIELAPIDKDALHAFISPGLQQASVSKYLSIGGAPVLEDEQEWFEKVRTDKTSIVWGIWHREESGRRLIGSTALEGIERHPSLKRRVARLLWTAHIGDAELHHTFTRRERGTPSNSLDSSA
jgi:RimJ/RimL family protein N-acetyltransferase